MFHHSSLVMFPMLRLRLHSQCHTSTICWERSRTSFVNSHRLSLTISCNLASLTSIISIPSQYQRTVFIVRFSDLNASGCRKVVSLGFHYFKNSIHHCYIVSNDKLQYFFLSPFTEFQQRTREIDIVPALR